MYKEKMNERFIVRPKVGRPGGQTPSEIEKKFCYKFKVLGNFLQSGPHDPVARGKLHGPPMCTTVKKRITIIEEL